MLLLRVIRSAINDLPSVVPSEPGRLVVQPENRAFEDDTLHREWAQFVSSRAENRIRSEKLICRFIFSNRLPSLPRAAIIESRDNLLGAVSTE